MDRIPAICCRRKTRKQNIIPALTRVKKNSQFNTIARGDRLSRICCTRKTSTGTLTRTGIAHWQPDHLVDLFARAEKERIVDGREPNQAYPAVCLNVLTRRVGSYYSLRVSTIGNRGSNVALFGLSRKGWQHQADTAQDGCIGRGPKMTRDMPSKRERALSRA